MRRRSHESSPRGFTLVEIVLALVVLTLGVLALGGLLPTGQRASQKDRMLTIANQFAQQKLEELRGERGGSAALSPGRHPAGSATEPAGEDGACRCFYLVSDVAGLPGVRRVDVTVSWARAGSRSVTLTTYLRP